MMTEQVPDHLQSTVTMIAAAFPEGISESERKPLLRALYDHMSDRNLADAMSRIARIPAEVLVNEVYDAAQLSIDAANVREMIRRLEPHGFTRWSQEQFTGYTSLDGRNCEAHEVMRHVTRNKGDVIQDPVVRPASRSPRDRAMGRRV